jgi:hypothetical protein
MSDRMTCGQARQEILMGDDPARAMEVPGALAEHVRGCGPCRELAAKLARLETATRAITAPAGEGPGAEFLQRVGMLAPFGAEARRERGRFTWVRRAVAAAILLVAGLGALTLCLSGGGSARAATVLNDLVAWNLQLDQMGDAAERRGLHARRAAEMRRQVAEVAWSPSDRKIAEALLANADWLATQTNPLEEAWHLAAVAEAMATRRQAEPDAAAAAAFERWHGQMSEAVAANLRTVDPAKLQGVQRERWDALQPYLAPATAPGGKPGVAPSGTSPGGARIPSGQNTGPTWPAGGVRLAASDTMAARPASAAGFSPVELRPPPGLTTVWADLANWEAEGWDGGAPVLPGGGSAVVSFIVPPALPGSRHDGVFLAPPRWAGGAAADHAPPIGHGVSPEGRRAVPPFRDLPEIGGGEPQAGEGPPDRVGDGERFGVARLIARGRMSAEGGAEPSERWDGVPMTLATALAWREDAMMVRWAIAGCEPAKMSPEAETRIAAVGEAFMPSLTEVWWDPALPDFGAIVDERTGEVWPAPAWALAPDIALAYEFVPAWSEAAFLPAASQTLLVIGETEGAFVPSIGLAAVPEPGTGASAVAGAILVLITRRRGWRQVSRRRRP